MVFIWSAVIIEIFILSLMKPLISNPEVVTICMVVINLFVVVSAFGKYRKDLRVLFCFAYILRVLAMFWDLYARNIYILPHSGSDSERFFYFGELISNNMFLLKESIYGGVYTKFLGILFYMIGPNRMIAQYINVLLGLSIIVLIYIILSELKINTKTIRNSILLAIFLPHAIIFSGILLRENMITALLVISLYYFIRWYNGPNLRSVLLSLIFLLSASSFHSGIIGIIVGYFYMYIFYSNKKNTFRFTTKSVFMFLILFIIGSFVYSEFSELIMYKFNRVDSIEELYSTANQRGGGSAYLLNLQVNSLPKMILFSPVFMFYFMFSPLPFNWRGINDVISFFMDSSIYLSLTTFIIMNFKRVVKERPIMVGLFIMLLFVILIFGIGVKNAGTAIRHRHKIYSIFIILYAVISDSRKRIKMDEEV